MGSAKNNIDMNCGSIDGIRPLYDDTTDSIFENYYWTKIDG